ncbi:hypothetical protein [Streptomyces cucumeris]|uniref:hypothetical protein n=1 Tax=Streptomyces cucumeris TaxID=2962890 RepID=UPI003EBA6C2E
MTSYARIIGSVHTRTVHTYDPIRTLPRDHSQGAVRTGRSLHSRPTGLGPVVDDGDVASLIRG